MLASRDGDGRYVAHPFTVGTGEGEWRPTSRGQRSELVGDGRPSVRPAELVAAPEQRQPRPLDSGAYAHEYDEVNSLGAKGSSRTPEQQALADFYQPNPVEMFNHALSRPHREAAGLSVADEARFYAMVNVATADTFIDCWAEKEQWSFLASRHRHPRGRLGRQQQDGWRPELGAVLAERLRTPTTCPATTALLAP